METLPKALVDEIECLEELDARALKRKYPALLSDAGDCSASGILRSIVAFVRMLKSPMPSTVQMCERDSETRQTVYSPTNFIASCAGFHPAEKPEYVIVVSFTKPKSAHTGEEVAVPAWNGIADRLSLQKD